MVILDSLKKINLFIDVLRVFWEKKDFLSLCLKFIRTGVYIFFSGNIPVAHTNGSAKALMNTIRMAYPVARLGFVVAMASDKDHVGFAREILSGKSVDFIS